MFSLKHLTQRKETVLAVALISLLAVVVYLNSIYNDFVMDDLNMIFHNLSTRKLSNIQELLFSSYRPVRYISYAVDYHFWGLNPVGYHMTNIILHLFCSLLVYGVVRRLNENNGLLFLQGSCLQCIPYIRRR